MLAQVLRDLAEKRAASGGAATNALLACGRVPFVKCRFHSTKVRQKTAPQTVCRMERSSMRCLLEWDCKIP